MDDREYHFYQAALREAERQRREMIAEMIVAGWNGMKRLVGAAYHAVADRLHARQPAHH